MKKLIAATFLSLTVLGLTAEPVHAGFMCCWKRSCYKYSISCRQYNAFTPCCFGNLYCDGCFAPPCCPPAGAPFGGLAYGGPAGFPADAAGCDIKMTPTNPFTPPAGPFRPPAPPIFNAPMPKPLDQSRPAGPAPMTHMWPQAAGYGMVQPTGYRPAYPPAYYGTQPYQPMNYPGYYPNTGYHGAAGYGPGYYPAYPGMTPPMNAGPWYWNGGATN